MIMIQTTIEKNKIVFNMYRDINDEGTQYKVKMTEDFIFRGYTMQEVGEMDFYNITQKELDYIERHLG